jgi:hypothetical protein
MEAGMTARLQILFPLLLITIVAALLGAGLFVYRYSWAVVGFPLGAGVFVCVMCAIDIIMTLTGRAPARPVSEAPLEPLSVSAVVWAFALLPFVFAFGFVFGSALYLLAYMLATGSSFRLSAIISAASLVVTWGLFIRLMRVPMPLEPLWWPW